MAVQQRKPRKVGYVQLPQQESQMRTRALKTASIRQVESLSRSTATREQLFLQKRERLNQSQVTKEELPKHG